MEKRITVLFAALLALSPAPVLFSCTRSDAPEQELFVTVDELTIRVGESIRLELDYDPQYVDFVSLDETIATVSQKGVVTGISTGETTVTASNSYNWVDIRVCVINSAWDD